MKSSETGPTICNPYPRRLESVTICGCNYKGSTFSSAILRPWVLVWDPFLETPETFREHFGWHNSLCIFKTKVSWGTKLCCCFNFYSLNNIWKDQLYRISGSEFYKWLFGPGKFSGLSRNRPLARLKLTTSRMAARCSTNWATGARFYFIYFAWFYLICAVLFDLICDQ